MISVNNLSFRYASAPEPAVSGIEFGVENGEIFGFLGPSGAGKSTTQKILIGLLKDYQGQTEVLGRSVSEWAPSTTSALEFRLKCPISTKSCQVSKT